MTRSVGCATSMNPRRKSSSDTRISVGADCTCSFATALTVALTLKLVRVSRACTTTQLAALTRRTRATCDDGFRKRRFKSMVAADLGRTLTTAGSRRLSENAPPGRRAARNSAQLAVLAAAPVIAGERRFIAIMLVLAGDAQSSARQRLAASLRDFRAALPAMR